MTRFAIYDLSRLVGWCERPTFEQAFRDAVKVVNAFAHADGFEGSRSYFRTANRDGYARGQFRCIPELAQGGLRRV